MKKNLLNLRLALVSLAFLLLLGRATPACATPPVYALGAAALLAGPGAGTNSIVLALTSGAGDWSATANDTWLHLSTENQTGTGSTNVIFTIDANAGATRSGTLTIGGQTLTITQAGSTYVAAQPVTKLTTNLTDPYGVAVDGAGNVYIADYSIGKIDEWTLTNQTLSTLVSNQSEPYGVAVNSAGTVFFSDEGGDKVEERMTSNTNLVTIASGTVQGITLDSAGNLYFCIPGGSNTISKWLVSNSNIVTVLSNLIEPFNVAVDVAGNIYFSDDDGPIITTWTAVTSSFSTNVTGGLSEPNGVAVDGSGNVYIADGSGAIKKWTVADNTTNATTLASGLNSPHGVAVDASGNVYYADSNGKVVGEVPYAFVDPTAKSEGPSAGSDVLPVVLPATENLLPPFAPASDQPWLTITGTANGVVSFSFEANPSPDTNRTAHITLLGQTITVTQDAPSYTLGTTTLVVGPAQGSNSVVLDVNPANPAWTATTNDTWLHLSAENQSGEGSTNVVFSFDANTGATRSGTLTIAGLTLTVTQAGSTYVAARPLTTLVANNNSYFTGVAADASGNVYIADNQNVVIDKWTAASGVVTPLVSSGMEAPHGVAVDGASNIYIADNESSVIYKWTAANSNLTTLISGLDTPDGVAVDGAGNVYVDNTFAGSDGQIAKWTAANSNLTTLIPSGFAFPYGVAVDAAGNVYIADLDNNKVEEWTAANGDVTTLVSLAAGSAYPYDAAVDGAGNVYIADTGDNEIKEWVAASKSLITLVSGLQFPYGVAVDGLGNVYFSDVNLNVVDELPAAFVDPTAKSEPAAGGSDSLPVVLPATENLAGPFVATSDSSWLTINGATNGVVSFSLTANTTGAPQTGHITLLGQTIAVTQASGPAFSGVPAGSNYGCNPISVPTTTDIQSLVSASDSCSAAPVSVTEVVNTNDCTVTQTFKLIATDTCTNSATNFLTNTWTVATLAISSVPANSNLGCNPVSLPTDASISNAVTFADSCSTVTNTVSHQDSANGCTAMRIFTITAGDTCGDTATAHVTNTWTVATLVISSVPANSNLGCNPVSLPTDASISNAVIFADSCSTVTNTVSHQDSIIGCDATRIFTITAGDACGDAATAYVTNTWTVATLVISSVPANTNLGCNPVSLPTDASISNAVTFADSCSTVTNTVSHQDSTNGCTAMRIFTINANDACGDTATAYVTNTWTVATLVISSVPANTNLGCNPVSLPTDASISNAVIFADSCSAVTNTVSHLDSSNDCNITRVFTINAIDACGDTATAYVTNTWTADTTAPVLIGVPSGADLGMNPASVPTVTNVQAEVSATDTCSPATVDVTVSNSANGSAVTQIFTIIATNDCGNTATAYVTNTWTASLFTNVVSALPAGGGTVGGGGVFASNSIITVTATPDNGYAFTNWTVNGVQASTSNSYTFALTSNETLVANFVLTPPHLELFNGSTNIVNGQSNAVDFGTVPLDGTGAVLTFTVSNTGGQTLVLSNIALPNGYEFDAIPSPIAPLSNATFMVHMDPAPLGFHPGSISITNNDPADNPFTFPVTGFVSAKILSLSGSLDFGVVPIETSSNRSLTISNSGDVTLTVSSITYPNGFSGAFSNTIAPSGSTNVTVTFSPVIATNYSGTVMVNSDAASGNSNILATAFGANPTLLLTIITNGDGKVTPNDARNIKQGARVSLTATAGTTNVFAGWTGSTNSTNNPLIFIMENSTIVQANFIPNPFLPFVGTYNGLFTATNGTVAETNAGMLKGLTLTSKGTYSGSLLINGTSKSISGSFDTALLASKSVSLGSVAGNVEVVMTLTSNGPALQVQGTVSNANWMATNLMADRASSNSLLSTPYTLLIPSDTNNTLSPGGNGYALISGTVGTAKTAATAKITGALADGTTFSQSTSVSRDGDIPIYANLYGSKGLVLGWINLTNASGATLAWVHPPIKSGLFTNAFLSTNPILLSPWTNHPEANALPAGLLVVGTTNNTPAVTNEFTIIISNNFKLGGVSNSTPLNGSLAPKTGLLTLTIGKGQSKTNGYAVILLNGTNGGGYFLTKTNAGAIILQP